MITLSVSRIRAGIFASALAVAAMASPNQAAAQQGSQLAVNIPFSFHNGSQILPAGRYTVSMENENLLMIQGDSGSGFAMTNGDRRSTYATSSKVTFRKYGDRYFLHEVWVTGHDTGRQVVKTKAEKQVQVAGNAVAPTDVELALNELPR